MCTFNSIETLEVRRLLSSSILADFNGIAPTNSVMLNGESYFAANDGTHGSELWKSDGTQQGTMMVSDILPGSAGSSPTELTVVGNKLLFFATNSSGSESLFSTDGTAAGTTELNIVAGSASNLNYTNFLAETGGLPMPTTVSNGKLYFETNNPFQVWSSDGTAAGTEMVLSLDAEIADIQELGNQILAADILGRVILSVDRTSGQMTQLDTGGQNATMDIVQSRGKVYFVTDDTQTTTGGLWSTDGTQAGTQMIKAISGASDIDVAGETIFISQNLPVKTLPDTDLWKSDGTAVGTVDVGPEEEGQDFSPDSALPNGHVVFFAFPQDLPFAQAQNFTDLITDTGDPSDGLKMLRFSGQVYGDQVIDDTMYFIVKTSDHQLQLWKTDGTSAGTGELQVLSTTEGSQTNYSIAEVNGQLLITTPTDTILINPANLTPIGYAHAKLTLTDGVLRIFGTRQNDNIRLYNMNNDPTRFVVNLNGVKYVLAYADVRKVIIYGYDGNDNIAFNDVNGLLALRSSIYGGAGNDTIYGSNTRDTLFGDEGNDMIVGSTHDDIVMGGDGNDSINSGAGDDTIAGQNGSDVLNGGTGADVISGGDDNSKDSIDGGAGENVIFGQSVYDIFFSTKNDVAPSADQILDS
jgi:ELWxxDGT repeat protein